MSRQGIYMGQRSGAGDMRSLNLPTTGFLSMLFKRLPTIDFIGRKQDITDYLSHLPETQVNRASSQHISVVKMEVL